MATESASSLTEPLAPADWKAVRVAAVVLGASVIVRHLAYWTDQFAQHTPVPMFAAILALIEAAALVRLIVLALKPGEPDRRRWIGLAVVSAVLAIVALANFANDVAGAWPIDSAPKVLAVLRLLALRTQLLAVPAMLALMAKPRVGRAL